MILLRSVLLRIKNSKHSKILFKLYIAWSICADLTLVGGIVWGIVYFW